MAAIKLKSLPEAVAVNVSVSQSQSHSESKVVFFAISGVWALDALALLRVFGLGLLFIFSESRVWFP